MRARAKRLGGRCGRVTQLERRCAARVPQPRGAVGARCLDVTTQSLDAVVSPETARLLTPPGSELVSIAADRTGRTVALNLTWRDVLYTYIVGRHVVVGGPTEVADFIEAWQVAGAVDGFNIRSAFLDRQFGAFVDLVIPELRRRGLFQSTYEGSTLREHLGLARPNSRFTLDQLVEVSS